MASMLEDLETLLINAGIAFVDGTNCFRDFLPESPDELTSLQEYAGTGTGVGLDVLDRNVQVSCRALTPAAAKTLAWAIYSAIEVHGDIPVTVGSRWMIIRPKQSPFRTLIDAKGRITYGFNINVQTIKD